MFVVRNELVEFIEVINDINTMRDWTCVRLYYVCEECEVKRLSYEHERKMNLIIIFAIAISLAQGI